MGCSCLAGREQYRENEMTLTCRGEDEILGSDTYGCGKQDGVPYRFVNWCPEGCSLM
jgi:hypothetical protein